HMHKDECSHWNGIHTVIAKILIANTLPATIPILIQTPLAHLHLRPYHLKPSKARPLSNRLILPLTVYKTTQTLKNNKRQMEEQVHRIWTVLSTFEGSSVACISEMLRHVSSGLYLEGVRIVGKFVIRYDEPITLSRLRPNVDGIADMTLLRVMAGITNPHSSQHVSCKPKPGQSLWMSGMSAMCLSSISCVTPNGPFLDLVPSPISLPRSPLSPYHHCTNLTPNHYSHQPMTICLPQPLIPEEPQTPDEPQVFLGKSISMNFPPNLRAP
ncbi:hypothetical protein PCASD_26121, partial [Puccinia coronata f. sp. avenae]